MPVDDDERRRHPRDDEDGRRGLQATARRVGGQAATIILDGVQAGKWRILVGDDAHRLDEVVRANPEDIYAEGGVNLLSAMQPGS